MIYTVTFNPAIDLFLDTDLNVGKLNRVRKEEYFVGGKGLNVSQVLQNLGDESIATGFVGGFTGEYIRKELAKIGISYELIECEGNTRINVKVQSGDEPTEINLNGVMVNEERFAELKAYLNGKLEKDDYLVISGNSARGLDETHFGELCALANDKEANLVLDTNENYLQKLLSHKPLMIKPNIHELSGVLKKEITTDEELEEAMKQLYEDGIRYVVVSAGSKGAYLYNGKFHYVKAFKGRVINTIGAGDSMVAAFVHARKMGLDDEELLRYCVAAGSATSFSEGLCTQEEINELLNNN
ncbi:MAG: 1-phosphofructokinase [Erysipelotrichaceae bacterium]|nr:1-phosphofructokinase [Erysipelotrichaceae bacterium]